MATNKPRNKRKAHEVTRPDVIAARERANKAVQLRLAGMTLSQIAETLGYAGPSGAHHAIRATLERNEAESVDDLRRVHRARLNRLLAGVWPRASQGDKDAMQSAARVMDQIAKLDGLYAAQRVEHGGVDGGPIETATVVTWSPDEAWTREFAKAWAEVKREPDASLDLDEPE